MVQEITVQTYTCRKCQSEDLVKNGHNRSGSPQYKCKACGTCRVLRPRHSYSEEDKQRILKAYEERPSLRGIERIFGVARQTVASWIKKGE